MTHHPQSQPDSGAKFIQSLPAASYILTPGALCCALLGGALLLASATAHAADGDWFDDTSSCSRNLAGDYYVGRCETSSDASGAEVIFDGAMRVVRDVYGGVSTDAGASHNTVTMSGGTALNDLYGGYSPNGGAISNTVTVSDGTVGGNLLGGTVFGGRSLDGEASFNTVTISGGTVHGAVYSGYSRNGGAISNTVVVLGGTVRNSVYGGYSDYVEVSRNAVTVSGGAVGDSVYGGRGFNVNTSRNAVTVSGGGVDQNVYGGYSMNGDAINNTVKMSGGAVSGHVYGGYSSSGNASSNIVTISGGYIGGNVFGGYSASGGATTGNRVILDGSPGFGSGQPIIYGGNNGATGNILEIRSKNLKPGFVGNFEEYHFLLPADTKHGDIILNLTATTQVDISGAKIGVAMQSGGGLLKKGDEVTLIHTLAVMNASNIEQMSLTGYQGVSLEYSFSLSSKPSDLFAIVTSAPAVRDQAKAPIEGRASTMALSQQGADLLAGTGMNNALSAVGGAGGASGIASFGALSGGRSRYHSGSHTDVNGVGLMLGLAKNFSMDSGSLSAGAFFEGGRGHYDTYNTFDTGVVRGSGRADYFGVGLLARHDWDSGLYAEGSVRGGRMNSDWSSRDMGAADASYDTSIPYYGAHVGLGFVWPLNERASLDVSAKYFWTHQGGDEVKISGDPYNFDATDSQRTRLGARVNYAFNDQFTGYAGAAWEHEYDGVARATVYGLSTPSPSLKGDTGVFEIGFNAKPDAKSPLTLGLGMQAYTGKREGVSGTLDVSWAF